jgi:imidazolonepropionase-like amidohydrolase
MKKTVFIHANVFDGFADQLLDDMIVVVADDKIEAVKPYSEENLFGDCDQVIDCKGMTLLPGLIDCHINLVGLITSEQAYGVVPRTVASSVLRGVNGGMNCINAGVTTLRVDSNGHHGTYALRDAFDAGQFAGPHMILPGRPICTTCGHGWNFGNHIADGPWEVRKAVREEIMAGAEWIKLMITGGAGTSTERINDQQMCREEIFAGIDEAHARGKKCFAHLTVTKAIYEAVEAGIDSVEHGIYLDRDCAQMLKQTNTPLVPTIGVYRRLVERGEKGLVPDYMYKKSLQIVDTHTKAFHHALDAGVRIIAGTDSGQDWFPAGQSLLGELEIMNEEGLNNAETLRSCTSNAAKLLETPWIGCIKSGANADILVVNGNPMRNMRDIRNTMYVMRGGKMLVNYTGK